MKPSVREAGGRAARSAATVSELRDARLARADGLAVAPRVAGDAADRHVDAVPRGGALFFGLATPEAVLTLLTRPFAALVEHGARVADGAGLRFANRARF